MVRNFGGNLEEQVILEEWIDSITDTEYRLAYYISDDGDDIMLEYYSDLWEEWVVRDPDGVDFPMFTSDQIIDIVGKEDQFSLTLTGQMNIIVGLKDSGPMEIHVNGKDECAEVLSAILNIMGSNFDVNAYTDEEGKILSSVLTKQYD
jgi:hypothetical protein